MFELMRPYVIVSNLLCLGWFVSLQYFRFKDTGRACSGDLVVKDEKLPKNFNDLYMSDQGQFFVGYIVAHYVVYIL